MVKNRPADVEDVRDAGSIPGWGRSARGGNGSPLAWKIPWTEEPSPWEHRVTQITE